MKQREILILSICIKKKRDCVYEFHFKGAFNGFKVKKIMINGGEFIEQSEYLIKAFVLKVEDNILYANYIKSKEINYH